MTRRTICLAGICLVAMLAIVQVAAPAALAHARYKSSTPGKGEAITASPAPVEIVFTQEIQKIAGGYSIEVVKDRGLDVTAGPAVVNDSDRTRLSVPLQPNLAAGRYVVNWTNVSDDDGDPATGAFSFYLNYTPNAVDLNNDAQLEKIGFEEEETPGADATPGTTSAATTTGQTAAATPAPAATAATSPAATSTPPSSDDDDDSNRTQYIIAAIAIGIVFVIALGGWQAMTRRRK
jgi:methionine-rich copper-binding protein CopC